MHVGSHVRDAWRLSERAVNRARAEVMLRIRSGARKRQRGTDQAEGDFVDLRAMAHVDLSLWGWGADPEGTPAGPFEASQS